VDEMDWTCGTQGRQENAYVGLVGETEEVDHSEHLGMKRKNNMELDVIEMRWHCVNLSHVT